MAADPIPPDMKIAHRVACRCVVALTGGERFLSCRNAHSVVTSFGNYAHGGSGFNGLRVPIQAVSGCGDELRLSRWVETPVAARGCASRLC